MPEPFKLLVLLPEEAEMRLGTVFYAPDVLNVLYEYQNGRRGVY